MRQSALDITEIFDELRAEFKEMSFPPGARPSISDLWHMATALYIAEGCDE